MIHRFRYLSGVHHGIIIFYLPAKGYGYLRLADTHEEFHFRTKNVLTTTLRPGDRVTFTLRQSKQGYFADRIERSGLA